MRSLILAFAVLVFSAACDRPSIPGTGSGGAIGDALKDNQSGHGGERKTEPESTPIPKKEM